MVKKTWNIRVPKADDFKKKRYSRRAYGGKSGWDRGPFKDAWLAVRGLFRFGK